MGQLQGTKNITDIHEITKDAGNELKELMKEELIKLDKVYTGGAVESIQYDEAKKLVYSDLIYVKNIEFGRLKGHPPPFDRIKSWVMTKMNLIDPQATEVTHAIVNKIARDGIPMTRFTKNALIKLTNGNETPRLPKKKKDNTTKTLKKFNKSVRKVKKIYKLYTKKSSKSWRKF